MVDVELVDDDREPRDYDPILKEVKFGFSNLIEIFILFYFIIDSRKSHQPSKWFQNPKSKIPP